LAKSATGPGLNGPIEPTTAAISIVILSVSIRVGKAGSTDGKNEEFSTVIKQRNRRGEQCPKR
jgi:hypothetical protein